MRPLKLKCWLNWPRNMNETLYLRYKISGIYLNNSSYILHANFSSIYTIINMSSLTLLLQKHDFSTFSTNNLITYILVYTGVPSLGTVVCLSSTFCSGSVSCKLSLTGSALSAANRRLSRSWWTSFRSSKTKTLTSVPFISRWWGTTGGNGFPMDKQKKV